MIRLLRTTTAIAVVMSMTLPSLALAQAACGSGEFPCTFDDGRVMDSQNALLTARLQQSEAELAEIDQKLIEAERSITIDVGALQERRTALIEKITKISAVLENNRVNAAKQAQAAADAQAKVAAERQAAAQAQADAEAQTAAQQQAAREAKAAADAQARADAERQAAADRAATQGQGDGQGTPQDQADTATATDPAVSADAASTVDPALTADAAQTERQAKRDARRAERQAARAQERAQSQAVSNTADRAATVETQKLTEQDVRTSDEEFDTAVTGQQTVEKDSGLSNFEKALLVGIGAVVVGQVLKNGDEVKSSTGDRVVVEREGELRVLKSDDALLRRAGNEVSTETFDDGSSRTTVTKPDGTRVVTILGADGTVLRRLRILPDGEEYVLVDDTKQERKIVVKELPKNIIVPQATAATNGQGLRAALQAEAVARRGGAFSLRQVRDIREVRALAPEIELDAVRFASGSAAIEPEQARSLSRIGNALRDIIAADPRTVLLVEGHTDAVGNATYNLALSDRRAETVALALTEYFGVPEENMIVQGYGESQLKVQSLSDEPANRRAVVRNITELLR